MSKQSIYVHQTRLFDIEPIDSPPKKIEKSENNFVFDMVDALSSPILTHNTLWADIIPKRLVSIIPLARLMAIKQGEKLATYVETTIYIYTRSLEAPMTTEWVDIYTHISCKTLEDWFGEDHWDMIKAPRKLNNWLQSILDRLRSNIYNKRREILKQHLKSQENTDVKQPTPSQQPSSPRQPSLFK